MVFGSEISMNPAAMSFEKITEIGELSFLFSLLAKF